MKHILLLFLILFLCSCSIQIMGITNDFKKLTEEQKSRIRQIENFENLEAGRIYTINASQLKQELTKHPKALVYVFTNGCSAEACKPLYVYEAFAKKHNYKLFLVMTGFGNFAETMNQNVANPLFAIDGNHYNTKIRSKYSLNFRNELMGKDMNEKREEFLGSLFFFEAGTFTKITRELPKTEASQTNNL